jgi:hypothetical protein
MMYLLDKSHTHKINFAKDLRAQKLTKLEEEICRFDAVLDSIQKLMPDDMRVYDYIVQVRDAMFKLQQSMRGYEIVEFACSRLEDITMTEDIDYYSSWGDD